MSRPVFDPTARKRTVSVTLNDDLYAKAKAAGINTSKVAEEALAAELSRRQAATIKAEIVSDLESYNQFVAEHGSPSEWVRDHRRMDDAV